MILAPAALLNMYGSYVSLRRNCVLVLAASLNPEYPLGEAQYGRFTSPRSP